jgi:hypothetical protein
MSGTRGGLGRIVAMGIALALALLLALVAEARAGKYTVAQCGWYVGADADWADSTGGSKFRPDGYCVPAGGGDPFDGSHLKSLTRDGGATVTGTRFARWRWTAPPGTAITQVQGTWWHALHDGLQQRIGSVAPGGGFSSFLEAAATNVTPRNFVAGFPSPVAAIEDRLLCARAESQWCSLDAVSWSSLRALTIVLLDPTVPGAGIGGELFAGWRRGPQSAQIWGADTGSGIRFGETFVDGVRAALTEYPCQIASIGGEWRGIRMQPCQIGVGATQSIATAAFSDGPHSVVHCVTDFSGNVGCDRAWPIHLDNTSPAHPRSVSLVGGDSWRRHDDFELAWTNPDQGPASPIAGAAWRLTGPNGFDSGVRFAPGRDRTSLSGLATPAPGSYPLQVWLRDKAGNEAPASAVTVPLRFDDVAPTVAFGPGQDGAVPEQLVALVNDAHSGPIAGTIVYRRAESDRWLELPTRLAPAASAGAAELRAPTPELRPGTYLFRADAADAAGNTASSSLRGDGTRMAIEVLSPAEVVRAKTRLFARLGEGSGGGDAFTVPFGTPALLSGRLTRADGVGIGGRELRIVARPSRGALAPAATATARTGERGGFELRLDPGPSRRVSVVFSGDEALEPSHRRPLELRVRSGVSLRAARTELTTGETLRLSGRVRGRGATIPRRGKLVAIQYLEEATGRWRPVLVTRSDHEGSFHARYRFRYVSGAARVRLRATALAEERWPYASGSSRPVTVDVSGR